MPLAGRLDRSMDSRLKSVPKWRVGRGNGVGSDGRSNAKPQNRSRSSVALGKPIIVVETKSGRWLNRASDPNFFVVRRLDRFFSTTSDTRHPD